MTSHQKTLVSDLYCTATVAAGVITLQNGRQIDLAIIELALNNITSTDTLLPCQDLKDTIIDIMATAEHALSQFNSTNITPKNNPTITKAEWQARVGTWSVAPRSTS